MSEPKTRNWKHSEQQGTVLLKRSGHIAELHLVRPNKMNALTPTMLEQLAQHLAVLACDDQARVVLLTSEGDRAFCTGADIDAFSEYSPLDLWRYWVPRGHAVFEALAALRQPSIAVIQGAALGGGLELALACDLRIAATKATFGLPEASIATVPGWGGTARLLAQVGSSRSKRLILTGDPIESTLAEQWGLVDFVVPNTELRGAAEALASKIASRAPVAVQLGKQLVTHANAGNVVLLEALAGALSATTTDSDEGIAAFRERRPPKFLGK